MISVDEAIRILNENMPPLRLKKAAISEAHSGTLAREIRAPEPSPRYTNSAMDGFAVRWQDVKGANKESPVFLRIAGESRAGVPYDEDVCEQESVRISTGAMLPQGADTVVRIEDTEEHRNRVKIFSVHRQGQDVRLAGEEFQAGELLLSQGTMLSARELSLLAAIGITEVSLFEPPGVSLLITGTELAGAYDKSIQPCQIRDSNSIMLASAVKEAGGSIRSCTRVQDDLKGTVRAMESAFEQGSDIILCSGGVSVGRHDHVREAAEAAGFRPLFCGVRQKPGKPFFAARKQDTLLLGLPGNPVSAFVCFTHYVRPMITALSGRPMERRTLTAKSGEQIANHGKRTNFFRVRLANRNGATPLIRGIEKQGSHMLSSIVHAHGYILLREGEVLAPDSSVEVMLF